jgi:hypothetical protein
MSSDEFRIYLDDKAERYCIVDEEDYQWALQWKWQALRSRGWKCYASRSTRLHGRAGPQTRIFMHKEILKRAGLVPPSPKHTIGDHRNGDSLDNRRVNLEWETHAGNARNLYGRKVKEAKPPCQPGPITF